MTGRANVVGVVAKEIREPIIYPQADKVLTETASAELSAFLQAGRMPEGWTCEKAAAQVAP